MATSFPAVYLNKLKELFAFKSHTHSEYAASNHTHSDYAAKSHNHDSSYAAKSHTHSEYAASDHTHTASQVSGCIRFPNYAMMTDIKTDYNNARSTGYTVSADGWIYATPMGSSVIKINGSAVIGQSENLTNKQMVPVRNGDKLSGGGASSIFFIPMR